MEQQLIFFGQVLLAILLGGILGWQRERRGKPAGARTYALVAAGAALFTILSVEGFGLADSARVASQVVVGIGFLGAGIIFHKPDHTEGLTTAAGLWAAAAIGMAVGVRFYLLAAATTLALLVLLILDDDRFSRRQAAKEPPVSPPLP
ncbi:MAG: MgtC/SapB family protein [Candidatus Magasanikbacteria bacterium]|nr:MgtC/SapB family protein [Candidatus Magasanikbacteria bacterium]